ncbi:MAG: TetR/AcrR family transcriptional regulator [Gemmatimonadota bacterium]|nr:TetR/AcrR family transcriptional regulator [Gammaproteobacteria bacterium]MDE2983079.1 TetR/AcrR family transcriptional regulator [Gemmatimonadota bacterium]
MAIATRERILEAAGRALSVSPNATVDAVAAEARVGRATVFRHFGSRAGLLRALGRRAVAETDRATREATVRARTATEALRLVMKAAVGAGESFRFLTAAPELYDAPDTVQAYERQLAELADLVEASKREGFIRPDVPTAWAVACIDGLIWAACRAVGSGAVGPVQAEDLVWDTLAGGLSAHPAGG